MNEAQRYLLGRHLGDFPVNKFEKDYTKLVYISDVMMDFVDDINSRIKQLEADKLEMAKAIISLDHGLKGLTSVVCCEGYRCYIPNDKIHDSDCIVNKAQKCIKEVAK